MYQRVKHPLCSARSGYQRSSERIGCGRPASMSQHVNRMHKEPKATRQLKRHEQELKSKD